MGYRFLCPADGQGMDEALEATRYFLYTLHTLPVHPCETLRALTAHESPLVLAELVALAAALLCWLWYLVTRNCSHVDRMWSILPPIYVIIFGWYDIKTAVAAVRIALTVSTSNGAGRGISISRILTAVSTAVSSSGADARLLVAAALATVWGCRLTFNFWRKGGYSLHYEDYRWAEVRKLMHPGVFEVFNLAFVALAQHALCLLITIPAFITATVGRKVENGTPQPLGSADWAAAALFALLLLGEVTADEQQWAFQRRKHQLLASGQLRRGDYKRGFRTTGLFRFSRHPNFFCEYGMWWSFYILCAVLPCRCLLGWSAAGAACLTLLFHAGSLWITERISAAKYPDYAAYQVTTSAIVPCWPGKRLGDTGSD
ncbi:hypothetical protein VaNZ11_002096 [Volvox africanus]|uniref:Steroid 5-alpha reductase C-terminal domain-containing protein n=1 Tax=Volvox africanus TaxID=51714 RepID=A0ABQ5RR38_9CHLO|nr:hypothetical protein VaNZ11_002096 [Volvox africanus]